MPEYDFDTGVDRRGSDSLKWDIGETELPMWVADMDFKAAPEILDALRTRVEHGVFGYSVIPNEWYRAIADWWREEHNTQLKEDWLIFCTGVVPAISSIVRKLTTPGEKILLQTPVYNIFFNSILNNGRHVLENRLRYNGERYCIDFEDLENKLADPQTTLMILCNPHNPIGKLWSREELKKIGDLCCKYHVLVLSDEIHCDLSDPGREYTPFVKASPECRDNSITCLAPTKAFNLAGLQTAAVMVPNDVLRHKVNRALNTDEIAEPNAFAITAAVAAFKKGKPWLDALKKYLFENKRFAKEFIEQKIPQLKIATSEATYLLWVDCSKLTDDSVKFCRSLRKSTGLYLSDGVQYGGNGRHFFRMNIACPRGILEEGLEKLSLGAAKFSAEGKENLETFLS